MTGNTESIPEFLMAMAGAEDVTWSIATFGAIAEFSRAPGEAGSVTPESNGFHITTPRGGLRYHHSPDAKIIAYEGLSKNPELWSQGISICLPEHAARMNRLPVLTETGPDAAAFHDRDRTHLLFDIGLGATHIDASVRTSDAGLIAELRRHTGQSLFEGDADALHAVLVHSPDRVFTSPLGRIEVATPIAHEDGETATGPHTHVLPELLAMGRTHAATVPIPDGYFPCMNIFPLNPARDERGDARPFDAHDHTVFQDILADYGDPAANAIKQQVIKAVTAGHGPGQISPPETRTERTALRVTLRQLRYTTDHSPVLADWPALKDWIGTYEPNSDKADG